MRFAAKVDEKPARIPSGFPSFATGLNQQTDWLSWLQPFFPQQCLNFFPLPHGQGSLRPTFGPERTGFAFSLAAIASETISLPLLDGADSPPLLAPPNAVVSWWTVFCGNLRRNCSNAIRLEALRNMLGQISVWSVTINSSKSFNASAFYSFS